MHSIHSLIYKYIFAALIVKESIKSLALKSGGSLKFFLCYNVQIVFLFLSVCFFLQ